MSTHLIDAFYPVVKMLQPFGDSATCVSIRVKVSDKCVAVCKQPLLFLTVCAAQVENKEVKKRILNDPVTYSEKFSENAKSVCEGLLAKEVDKRLGFKNGSCDELRSHPFFSELNWRKLDAGADATLYLYSTAQT